MQKNSAQERAVSHNQGPMMLLAGPGSGKTTTITRRVADLIKKYQVTPSSILVVTFTKAASREMKERFLRLCEEEGMQGAYREVTFGTFHGIFYGIDHCLFLIFHCYFSHGIFLLKISLFLVI